MTKSRNISPPRHKWTAEEEAVVRARFADETTVGIAADLSLPRHVVDSKAHHLGLKKSAAFLASTKCGRFNNFHIRGQAFRFKKGIVPWSKGRKLGTRGRAGETQFKKGGRPKNYLPIGTERTDSNGYLRRKVADGPGGYGNTAAWAFVHVLVWEAANGPAPAGSNIRFKDGNRSNCVIGNLELIADADVMRSNSIHTLPADLKNVIQLGGQLKRMIAHRKKKIEENQREEQAV